jgi:hypothetical protein
MDVKFEGGILWVPVTVPARLATATAQEEVRYVATIGYDFSIAIGDMTVIAAPHAAAEFTVRNAGSDASPKWQLVDWKDLGGGRPGMARLVAEESKE